MPPFTLVFKFDEALDWGQATSATDRVCGGDLPPDEAVEELEQQRAGRLLEEVVPVLGDRGRQQLRAAERLLGARFLRCRTKVSVGWLAGQLAVRTRGTMSHGLCLIAQRLDQDKVLARKWRQLGEL